MTILVLWRKYKIFQIYVPFHSYEGGFHAYETYPYVSVRIHASKTDYALVLRVLTRTTSFHETPTPVINVIVSVTNTLFTFEFESTAKHVLVGAACFAQLPLKNSAFNCRS